MDVQRVKTESWIALALVAYIFLDRVFIANKFVAAPDLSQLVHDAFLIVIGFYFGSSKSSRMRAEKETGNGPTQKGVGGGQDAPADPSPAAGAGGAGVGQGSDAQRQQGGLDGWTSNNAR